MFPDGWTASIILSLFKQDPVNDPNHDRRIYLCDITSTLYSSIINNRLQELIEQENVTGEWQAVFKKNYSTTDHMLTFLAAVQKQFSFDRNLMWHLLTSKRHLIREHTYMSANLCVHVPMCPRSDIYVSYHVMSCQVM